MRSINAENTRLTDINDKLNYNNQEGLLLLTDFEKAFDSVEWYFLNEALIKVIFLIFEVHTCSAMG